MWILQFTERLSLSCISCLWQPYIKDGNVNCDILGLARLSMASYSRVYNLSHFHDDCLETRTGSVHVLSIWLVFAHAHSENISYCSLPGVAIVNACLMSRYVLFLDQSNFNGSPTCVYLYCCRKAVCLHLVLVCMVSLVSTQISASHCRTKCWNWWAQKLQCWHVAG